jgi:hypothetical protein
MKLCIIYISYFGEKDFNTSWSWKWLCSYYICSTDVYISSCLHIIPLEIRQLVFGNKLLYRLHDSRLKQRRTIKIWVRDLNKLLVIKPYCQQFSESLLPENSLADVTLYMFKRNSHRNICYIQVHVCSYIKITYFKLMWS